MDDFGWNLATVQALGTVAAAIAVLIALRSAFAAIRTANTAARESKVRTRPWLKVEKITLRPNQNGLDLVIGNVGLLPAEAPIVKVKLAPWTPPLEGTTPDADSLVIGPAQFPATFPGDHTTGFLMVEGSGPRWTRLGPQQIIIAEGEIKYRYISDPNDKYSTKFKATWNLSESPTTPTQWGNIEIS